MTWAQGWFWADFLAWWISAPGRRYEAAMAARRLARIVRRLTVIVSALGVSFEDATTALAPLATALQRFGGTIGDSANPD